MMPRLHEVADLDEKCNQRRVTDTLNNLLKDARNGRLKCAVKQNKAGPPSFWPGFANPEELPTRSPT